MMETSFKKYTSGNYYCTARTEPVEVRNPYSCSCFDRAQHERLGCENFFINPPTPQDWGEFGEEWGTPPNPRQRGAAPCGIPIFVLQGIDSNPGMADYFKNVILNPPRRMKNLTLREREYDNFGPFIVLSPPLTPQSWGEFGEEWGTPPTPRQRGAAPCGILIFMFHGLVAALIWL
jgi:hypothetical protein